MPRPIRILCLLAGALTLFAARANAATLTLAWNANPETDVTGYFVIYGTAPGIYTSRLDASNHTQFQIPNLVQGRSYFFAVQAYNSSGELSDASDEVYARIGATAGDFTGDGQADLSVYRPGPGIWSIQSAGDIQWGLPGDVPVSGDYDNDSVIDLAVFRPPTGMWFIRNQTTVQWGLPGDIPVPADYNGDGATDLAVYRPSDGMWHLRGQFARQWGLRGDVPIPADYDADGKADLAVFRPSSGTWFMVFPSTGFTTTGASVWGAV